jgi:UDP-glucose 4-epimerase
MLPIRPRHRLEENGKAPSRKNGSGRNSRSVGALLALACPGPTDWRVIEMIKRVSGVEVEIAPRRPGNPAQIVAASERSRMTLGWKPQYDDLATITGHALA